MIENTAFPCLLALTATGSFCRVSIMKEEKGSLPGMEFVKMEGGSFMRGRHTV